MKPLTSQKIKKLAIVEIIINNRHLIMRDCHYTVKVKFIELRFVVFGSNFPISGGVTLYSLVLDPGAYVTDVIQIP